MSYILSTSIPIKMIFIGKVTNEGMPLSTSLAISLWKLHQVGASGDLELALSRDSVASIIVILASKDNVRRSRA